MKIFSAPQIKACDAYTISAAAMLSTDLMERAASKCAEWIMANYPKDALFVVLCGSGNNGGDGLAIARMLHQQGYGVKAFLLQLGETLSDDCSINLQRLHRMAPTIITSLAPDTYITDIAEHIIIIDAILGTGLDRPAEGWLGKFINKVNELPNKVISVDMPSGLPADTLPAEGDAVVNAAYTLSFQFYKRSFLHPEGGRHCGSVQLLDIGLNKAFIEATGTNYHSIDISDIKERYHPRTPFTHKGTYGTAFLVGGSYSMIGAISLAAMAASRAGAGKVRVLLPEAGYDIIQTLAPEAMCITKGEKHINEISGWTSTDAIGIGSGMGTASETVKAFAEFIEEAREPIVIDADALNIIAQHPELLTKVPAGSILTPHPKEFERLFGATGNTMQRLELARIQAMRYNIHIMLKDRHTAVVTPDGECWYNLSGNAGLATAGSGDVLMGIVTGLLAQKYTPTAAAILGIYLHGKAGEYAALQHSKEAMIAGDIINNLGKAFQYIETQ